MQIKICGITNEKDARLAIYHGANLLGFNFYPKSPRYIQPLAARRIIQSLHDVIPTVGIFVNENLQQIQAIKNKTGIDYIQLHGDEDLRFCETLSFPVIKAIRPQNEVDIHDLPSFINLHAYLIDSYQPTRFGGTGQLASWKLAKKIATTYPLFLAGGLNADNVQEALHFVKPQGIDLCSSLEVSFGQKCPDKLTTFFEALRGEKS